LARILFAGLWCQADRAGRLEDRPKRIQAKVLPYDDCDCDKLLSELESRGFIVRYVVESVSYIAVSEFSKHQNPHVKEAPSTIPAPCKSGARTVKGKTENRSSPSDSFNLIPDSLNTDSLQKTSAKPSDEGSALAVEAVITIPLNTGPEHPVTEAQVSEFRKLYPAVNVMQEFRAMRAWALTNPTKRKTKTGIMRFVNAWLAKAQDNSGGKPNGTHQPRESVAGRAERVGNEHLARLEEAERGGNDSLLAAHGRDLRA
jgi:cytoskeletal protein RodZ